MLLGATLWGPGFIMLAAFELAMPVWAERAAPTTWHPHHIAERYGLLTLIVLGESILAATVAIQSALASGEALPALLPLIGGGLLIAYSMWWMYFDRPVHDLLTSLGKAIFWGYGHYFVFAAAAAVGAGLAVCVDEATHHAKVSAAGAGAAVAIPVAVYLVCLWYSSRPAGIPPDPMVRPDRRGLVLLTPLTVTPCRSIGVILTALVVVKQVLRARHARLMRQTKSIMISKSRSSHAHVPRALLVPMGADVRLSTLVMNHRAFFVSRYGEGPIPYAEEQQLVYNGVFPESADLKLSRSRS